jgi:addiction module HigA family antidote
MVEWMITPSPTTSKSPIIIKETTMIITEKRPLYPIHPGTILGDELNELNISPAALARELHVPSNRIYQLLAGKRAMTADTALRLQQWLGVEAAFWLNLQKSYELDLAAGEIGAEIERTIHRRKPFLHEESQHIAVL